MIHPHTELRYVNDTIGYGVFAKAFIPAGTITYIKDGLEIEVTPTQYQHLDAPMRELVDKYSFKDERGVRVVSWDFAKYVNHCCQCNTMSTGYGFEIALRDILPGEELTDEYGLFNVDYDIELSCSKPGCRKRISVNDFDLYHTRWDAQVREALALFGSVEQPLAKYLDAQTAAQLQHYLQTGQQYKSVYSLKYEEKKNGTPHISANGLPLNQL